LELALTCTEIGGLVCGYSIRDEPAHAVLHALMEAVIFGGLRFVRQPEAGQRHPREADAEFLQRCAAGDGLGKALGEFIEFIVHTFPFCVIGSSFNLKYAGYPI